MPATMKLSAVPYTRSKDGCIQIQISLMIDGPTRKVGIKTLEDAKREYNDFAREMIATGKPWRLVADISKGRKPRGFDAAKLGGYVNDEAARAA